VGNSLFDVIVEDGTSTIDDGEDEKLNRNTRDQSIDLGIEDILKSEAEHHLNSNEKSKIFLNIFK